LKSIHFRSELDIVWAAGKISVTCLTLQHDENPPTIGYSF
jgi:hypothetical protein